jgi:hypothetical protein
MNKKVIQEIKRIKSLSNILVEQTSDSEVLKIVSKFLKNVTSKDLEDDRVKRLKDYFKDIILVGVGDDKFDLNKISDKGKELLSNPNFDERLNKLSQKIGVDKNSIIKLMNHESKLNPSITNNIGCTGLIQLCPDKTNGNGKTINGVTYDLNKIKTDLNYQMDVIEKFWSSGVKNGKIKSNVDLYLYNFFPVAAGKPDNFVLQTRDLSAEEVAHDNPIFNQVLNRERSTPLTVGDIKTYYSKTGMI